MTSKRPPESVAFAYLTVVEQEDSGYVGGLLMLDVTGRPLEFHCTSPIRPSRAQEILYGPTLEAYLFGEKIGRALVQACRQKPSLVLTDRSAMLASSTDPSIRVVQIVDAESPAEAGGRAGTRWRGLTLNGGSGSPADQAVEMLERLQLADVAEPFERVRTALLEAERSSRGHASRRSGEAA